MAEDKQEQGPGASEAEAAPVTDVADEEDLDVVLERVAPRRSGGVGWFGWLIVVVLVAVVAAGGYIWWRQIQIEQEQARQDRQTAYQGQEREIMAKVERAAKDASAGHLDAALDVLEAAEVQWSQIAQGAQAVGDADIADRATQHKKKLGDVLKGLDADRTEATKLAGEIGELEKQIKALQGKQDEVNARVRDAILKLANEPVPAAKAGAAAGNAEESKAEGAGNAEAVPEAAGGTS